MQEEPWSYTFDGKKVAKHQQDRLYDHVQKGRLKNTGIRNRKFGKIN
jgi:hypothetical protein